MPLWVASPFAAAQVDPRRTAHFLVGEMEFGYPFNFQAPHFFVYTVVFYLVLDLDLERHTELNSTKRKRTKEGCCRKIECSVTNGGGEENGNGGASAPAMPPSERSGCL